MFYKKNLFDINFNNTKEVTVSLLKAENLTLNLNNFYIEKIHLLSSIFIINSIVSYIFNFNLNNYIINYLIEQKKFYKSFNTINNKKVFFSIKLLNLIIYLYYTKKFINTIDILFELFKDKDYNLKKFLFFFNITKNNLIFGLESIFFNKFFLNYNNILKNFSKKLIKLNIKVFGREKEIINIIEILSRQIKRNIILIGEVGIGKNSIINELLKYLNYYKNKLFLLQGIELWEINIFNLFRLLIKNKNLNDSFKLLKKKIIFICYDINLLNFNNDNSINTINLKFNILNNCLLKNEFQIIGITTINEYNKNLINLEIINKFFDIVYINELKENIIKKILNNYSYKLENLYGLYILPETLIETLILSKKYLKYKKFPEKAFQIIDSACVKFVVDNKLNINLNKLNLKFIKINKFYIRKVVSDISGLNINLISNKINNKIKNLKNLLKLNIFGQDKAIIQITNIIQKAQIGLKNNNKPIGSWIFCGPSGTGKTELSKLISKILFGSESELIRFDMSEFMEKHSISKLIGSPPGYIGYEEGGQLTNIVKKKPFCVILFDEIEKAHKDINNLMLQLLDEGRLTDSSGNLIDFSNTIIIFTSNLGCDKNYLSFNFLKNKVNFNKVYYKNLINNIKLSIKKQFRIEFINRLDSIIIFKPLNIFELILIFNKFFNLFKKQLYEKQIKLSLNIKLEVKYFITKLSYNPLYGARILKRLINKFIEKPICELILNFNLKKNYNISFFINKKLKFLSYSLIKF